MRITAITQAMFKSPSNPHYQPACYIPLTVRTLQVFPLVTQPDYVVTGAEASTRNCNSNAGMAKRMEATTGPLKRVTWIYGGSPLNVLHGYTGV